MPSRGCINVSSRANAFSSEVDTGSREENASEQKAFWIMRLMFSVVRAAAALAVCAALLLAAPPSDAQSAPDTQAGVVFSPALRFTEQGGESLYRNVCSACHMMDGRGASGAGTFPSLAGNGKLQAAGYPLYVVTNGLHGMPPLGAFMSDEQVAAVVNYVRTHFGNSYQDAVTAEDAKAARP
jgi:mono/diheme cytochrome c family protein